MVQEVYPEGLIAADGRLQPGDQIIEINGVDMTCATHAQVRNKDHQGNYHHSYYIKMWNEHNTVVPEWNRPPSSFVTESPPNLKKGTSGGDMIDFPSP